jgi:hypothetical protein
MFTTLYRHIIEWRMIMNNEFVIMRKEAVVNIVAITKLHASKSQQNRTTLHYERRSPGM